MEGIKTSLKKILKIAHKLKVINITGRTRVGKTNLAFTLLEEIKKHKPVFIFKHPSPEMIEKRGYKNLYSIGEIENLHDCALFLDEPQLYIKRYEKKTNESLEALMTLCGQRNITLILCGADTRFVTRGLEYHIDSWLILDLCADLVKRGSLISKIIKRNALITTTDWRLPIGKFLFYSREYFKLNGKKEFPKLKWFSEKWSKPYREE